MVREVEEKRDHLENPWMNHKSRYQMKTTAYTFTLAPSTSGKDSKHTVTKSTLKDIFGSHSFLGVISVE